MLKKQPIQSDVFFWVVMESINAMNANGGYKYRTMRSNSRNNRVRRGKRKDYADKGDELHLNIAPRPTGSLGVPLPDAPGRGQTCMGRRRGDEKRARGSLGAIVRGGGSKGSRMSCSLPSLLPA